MARARNIKPGLFKNEELAELGPGGMCLFAGLWTLADRAGRLEDRPRRIKAEIFPYFEFDVDGCLDALQDRGFIVRYEADGSRYIQVTNFEKHQTPHIKEAASTIPAPGEHQTSTVQGSGDDDANTLPAPPDSGFSDSLIADSGLLGGGADAPAKTKRATQIPEDWIPVDRLRRWAFDHEFTPADIERETTKFIRHHRSKGNVFKDIGMAWQNWMERSREYGPPRASPTNGTTRVTSADRILAAGKKVQERHEQRGSDAGDVADRRGVRAEDAGSGPGYGPSDRGVEPGPGGRPVEAVWRERS